MLEIPFRVSGLELRVTDCAIDYHAGSSLHQAPFRVRFIRVPYYIIDPKRYPKFRELPMLLWICQGEEVHREPMVLVSG